MATSRIYLDNNPVVVECYGKTDRYDTRKDAIDFYRDCADCAEGSEWERYARVLLDLYAGKSHATDRNPYDEEDF